MSCRRRWNNRRTCVRWFCGRRLGDVRAHGERDTAWLSGWPRRKQRMQRRRRMRQASVRAHSLAPAPERAQEKGPKEHRKKSGAKYPPSPPSLPFPYSFPFLSFSFPFSLFGSLPGETFLGKKKTFPTLSIQEVFPPVLEVLSLPPFSRSFSRSFSIPIRMHDCNACAILSITPGNSFAFSCK